jgi:hypothetical protein
MAVGILTRETTLHNEVMAITLPKGTIISFMGLNENGVPTIVFKDVNVRCEWHQGYWYAIVYDKPMLIHFPQRNGKVPFPFSYFRQLEVKNA